MTDDLEQRLRGLRPLPMPAPVRRRIVEAVRAAPRQPRPALRWLPASAAAALAASLAVAVLAVRQPAASRAGGVAMDDTLVSYGLLQRHLGAPEELLEMIDRSRRPIPRFAAFDHEPSARNRP